MPQLWEENHSNCRDNISRHTQAADIVVSSDMVCHNPEERSKRSGAATDSRVGKLSYTWTWLHKLRRAMLRPDREKLRGCVEVDEAYIGGPEEGGKRGRGTENKVLVVVAAEVNGKKIGRVRMAVVENASSSQLHPFVENCVEKGSTIITDGWSGYNGLSGKGYFQETIKVNDDKSALPHVHIIISLVKRWLLGTLQGSWSKEYIGYYLDEFTFRFNRRNSRSRGMLFYRLLQNAGF